MNTRTLGLELGLTKNSAGFFKALTGLSGKISGKPGAAALAKAMRSSPNVAEQLVGHAAQGPLYGSKALRGGEPLTENLLKLFGERSKAYPTDSAFDRLIGFTNSLDSRTLNKAPMSLLGSNREVLKSLPDNFLTNAQKALQKINAA